MIFGPIGWQLINWFTIKIYQKGQLLYLVNFGAILNLGCFGFITDPMFHTYKEGTVLKNVTFCGN